MPVVHPVYAVAHSQGETNKTLEEISQKLTKLIPTPNLMRRVKCDGFELFSRARLVWWTKVNEAARYRVILHVLTEERAYEIGSFDVERGRLYIFFPDIPNDVPCLARVEAEDRGGKVIAKGEIKL